MASARVLPRILEAVVALEDSSDLGSQEQLARAVQLDVEATGVGCVELAMRARVAAADAQMRLGDVTTATRTAEAVNHWAHEHSRPYVLACSHRVLAGVAHLAGDSAGSLVHAVAAVELLGDDAPPLTRGRHLMMVADALGWNRAFDQARDRYLQAEQLFVTLGATDRLLHVLNNLAYSEHEAGHRGRAHEAAERLLVLSKAYDVPLDGSFVDTIARARMGVGRYAEAGEILVGALTGDRYGGVDSSDAHMMCELLLTLAEVRRRSGEPRQAQEVLDDSCRRCDAAGLGEMAVRIQREQAQLHASTCRWEEAYRCLHDAVAAGEALTTAQQAEAAITRHAVLQVREARSESEAYREQALRDALTGMRNRRFLDAQLPLLLHRAVRDGTTTVVAIIDVDHFKQVNDTYSHEVGDQVLVRVADILASAVLPDLPPSSPSFAARIGGEEFAVVLAQTTVPAAGALLEALRRDIRAAPWRELADGLRLTASIGAVAVTPGQTQSELLHAADLCLYEAKRAGRDRLVMHVPSEPAGPSARADRRPRGAGAADPLCRPGVDLS